MESAAPLPKVDITCELVISAGFTGRGVGVKDNGVTENDVGLRSTGMVVGVGGPKVTYITAGDGVLPPSEA